MEYAKKYTEDVKVVKKRLVQIIAEATVRTKSFYWAGRAYGGWYGMSIQYESARDLTAAVWEFWYDHQIGDVPHFHLQDVIKAMGDLWDESVIKEVWSGL